MARTIDFYFDFLSPYAYLAHHRLPRIAARHGCEIAYHPIDLQAAKIAVGNTAPASREMPMKHRYLRTDLKRWADHYGVPFQPPAGYGSQRLNCGAFYAIDRGVAEQYNCAWHEVWGRGGAMDDTALLRRVAAAIDWNVDDFLAYAASGKATARLNASNTVAFEHGVFGVPTMLVDDQLWWGNDRLEFLEKYLVESANEQKA